MVAGDGIGVQVLSPLSLDICLGEDLHPRVTNNPVTKVEDGGMSERRCVMVEGRLQSYTSSALVASEAAEEVTVFY